MITLMILCEHTILLINSFVSWKGSNVDMIKLTLFIIMGQSEMTPLCIILPYENKKYHKKISMAHFHFQ